MMKSILFSTVFALAFTAHAASVKSDSRVKMKAPTASGVASEKQAPLSLSPTVGIAHMKVKNFEGLKSTPDSGASIGALVDIQTQNKNLFIQSGLVINQFGTKIQDVPVDGGLDVTGVRLNLTYLNVPAIAKLNVLESGNNTFFVKGGLMPGILIQKEIKAAFAGQTLSGEHFEIKTIDLPAVVGLGARIPFQKEYALMLDATYVHSMFSLTGKNNTYNEGFVATAGINVAL